MSLSFYKKETKVQVVREGHVERVLNAAGKFIDKEIIAKAFMVALNSAEYIPALELLSKEGGFQNLDTHPLPQYLAFACFTLADDEASFTALLDFTCTNSIRISCFTAEGIPPWHPRTGDLFPEI
jgi:hypothetical protein